MRIKPEQIHKIVTELLKYRILDSFGLSGQFLDCPDSFLIVQTVFKLSGQFLNCPDSFWVVRKVLDYPDMF